MITTGIDNFTIWEGTQEQISHAGISENDLAFVTDVSFEEKFRYSVMPEATADNVGQIVQYIGGTNANYKEGSYYKCVAVIPHIDTIHSGIGLIVTFITDTGTATFESFCETNDSDCAYMEITGFNTPYSPSRCNVTGYYADGTASEYVNSGATITEIFPEMGLAYSNDGRIGTVDVFRVYRLGYTWQLLETSSTVDFENITGNPRDNTALNTELNRIETSSVIQVNELPVVTEDNKDKIYQYIGNDDPASGKYKGSFYFADEARWEIDRANSYLADDMYVDVTDEQKFLSWLRAFWYGGEPDVEWLEVCFDRGNTTDTEVWIDTTLYPSYEPYRQSIYSLESNYALKVTGSPTATNDRSTCTRVRINVYKLNDYSEWTWKPLNMYPLPSSNVSLYNISQKNTSIVEHLATFNESTAKTPYSVIIGVNSRSDSQSGYSVALGYQAKTHHMGIAVGANTVASIGGVAVGHNAKTYGEWGVCVGNGSSEAYDRSAAVGVYCISEGQYSGCFGTHSKTQGAYSATLGYHAYTTSAASGAIQLGEGTNPTANTLQFRSYTLLDANGVIPSNRLSAYSPEDGYALVYDEDTGEAQWKSIIADIPEIQVEEMPEAEEGKVVQYIGEDDGELIKGYWYEAVYDSQGDYWYWNQINVQPTINTVSYDNVTDKPSINGVTIEGDLDLVEDFGLKRVATTGSYADLTTKPGINGHALLANTTAADLQISYNDLIDKPADPTTQLPDLPSDKDDYDYMLKWDHTQGKLVWYRATDTQEDLGIIPEPAQE